MAVNAYNKKFGLFDFFQEFLVNILVVQGEVFILS
jgi:hypothetical protein